MSQTVLPATDLASRSNGYTTVLVTGYRGWTDKATIARALTEIERAERKRNPGARMCLAHGGCRGADEIAALIARNKH